MPRGESIQLRDSHFKRTGSKVYGIRNRTPDNAFQLLANLNELSEKTRRVSLRVPREEDAQDGASKITEGISDLNLSSQESKPKTLQLAQLQVPLSQWTYIGLMLWEPYLLNKSISVNQLEIIICRGLQLQPFFDRLI